jgi:sarcosine oxidase subunit delta
MALMIACPNCGRRPYTEYWWGGEMAEAHTGDPASLEDDFARVWLHANVAGDQAERWFHFAGCRRWLTARRDTRTNVCHDDV